MKYLILLLITLLLLHAPRVRAQFIDHQEVQLVASNVLFGGLTTGLGAVINKSDAAKVLPTFWKGFKYGCVGGVLLYTGKKCTNLIAQREEYFVLGSWSSRLIHNAGASIMENAALHRPVLSHYNLYVGFMRLEFDWQEKFHVAPRVMPLSLGVFTYQMIAYKGRLDVVQSLKYGSPYIITNEPKFVDYAGGAAALGNVMMAEHLYYDATHYREVAAHENIHVLQYHEDLIFTTHLKPVYDRIKGKYSVVNKLSKYVFFDMSPIIPLSYLRKAVSDNYFDCKYKNPYEFEAYRMTSNKHIDVKELCK